MDTELHALATKVAHALKAGHLTLTAAESCTGGWVAKALTDVAGSSAWFERGLVTYSNRAKQELLGVRAQTLETEGAVSEATVREMVAGARAQGDADVAVAISGIAGPDGGTPGKPVGTVWFAWSAGDRVHARVARFPGDREAVRRAAVIAALDGVLDALEW